MKIESEVDFYLSFDIALSLTKNSKIVITISEIKEPTEVWYLHYTCSRSFISAKVIHFIISNHSKNYFFFLFNCNVILNNKM